MTVYGKAGTPSQTHKRHASLAGLIGLWPRELEDYSVAASERIACLLRRALRAERKRGQSGHWTYDINRHMKLSGALKAELAFLQSLNTSHQPVKRPVRNGAAPSLSPRAAVPVATLKGKTASYPKIFSTLPGTPSGSLSQSNMR